MDKESKDGWSFARHGFRYVVLALGVCCLTTMYCNYTIINFTFICMSKDQTDLVDVGNGTLRQRYDYSTSEKSYIMWAVAAGTIVGTFPINWAYVQWGARYTFLSAGLLSAAATGLSPLAAHSSLWLFVALRFLQGLAYAADFAAIGIIVVRWAPLNQTAIFISLLTSFSPIAQTITNPVAGFFCETVGWRWAFYFNATLTLFFFVLWSLFYSDDPELHSAVSTKELSAIQLGKSADHIKRDSFVPYKEICKDKAILVVWLNAFTEITGYIIMMTYAPIYIYNVLGYSVAQTAFLASVGSLLHLPLRLLTGLLSDKITCISEKLKMCLFNTCSVGVAGVLCGLIGLMPTPLGAVLCLSASAVVVGMNPGGFYKCGSLHARQYSHFVLATIQFSKCAALIFGPLMVAVFTRSDGDAAGWVIIFLLNAGLMLIANFLFYFTATDQPAEFTLITRKTVEAKKQEDANQTVTCC